MVHALAVPQTDARPACQWAAVGRGDGQIVVYDVDQNKVHRLSVMKVVVCDVVSCKVGGSLPTMKAQMLSYDRGQQGRLPLANMCAWFNRVYHARPV